jgi:hypothetical protein
MSNSKNYAYKASGIIKIVFTKDGQFVTTIMSQKQLKNYPSAKYDIVEII